LAVMSSPTNSSGWPTDSTTPHDNLGDMPNCQSAPNGSSISWPSNGSASGHNQDVFTDTDFDSPQNTDALRIPFHAPETDQPQAHLDAVVGIPWTGSSHFTPVENSSAIGTTSSGINITNVTTNANGSTTETVTFAGSGIVFNNTFDTSVSQAYKNCILS